MELQRRSSGVAKGGLTTGIIGTALGGLNSLALMGAGVNAASRNNNDTVEVVTPVNSWGWGPGFGFGGNWGGAWGNPWFAQQPQTVVINSNEDRDSNRDRNGYGYGRNGEGCCSEDHFVNRYELELQQKIAEKDSQIALRDANTYNDQKMLEMYKYIDGELKNIRGELGRQAVVNQRTEDSFRLAEQDLNCCCKRLETAICNEARERQCRDNTIITYSNATFYPKQVADLSVLSTSTPQTVYNPLPQNDGCCGCYNNN